SSRQPSVGSSCSGQGTPATEAGRADGRHDGPAQSITALPARTGCPRRGNLGSLEARASARESSESSNGPTRDLGGCRVGPSPELWDSSQLSRPSTSAAPVLG